MNAQYTTLLQSPGWWESRTATLFRAQCRRLWNARTLRTSLWTLAGVLLIQLVVGILIETVLVRGGNTWRNLLYGSSALGLYASWTTALFHGLGVLPVARTFWHLPYPVWLVVLTGLIAVPIQMLAPAFAAMSIVPARENGQIEELLLAGFTPRQILWAKGLAALAPFLMLWLLLESVTLGLRAYEIAHPFTFPNGVSRTPATLWLSFGLQVITALTMAARLGLLVCVSALCRRYHTALVACYGIAFLWPVLTQLILLLSVVTGAKDTSQRMFILTFTGPILIIGALVLILPRALHAIGSPAGDQPPLQRRLRIKDYGTEDPES